MPQFQGIDPDATYSVAEAATVRDVTPSTVRRAIAAGRLPAAREGRDFLISGRALRSWYPASTQRPAPASYAPSGHLTVLQVAKFAGMSRTSVYLAIKDGRLRARRIRGRLVVAEADAEAWCKQSPGLWDVKSHPTPCAPAQQAVVKSLTVQTPAVPDG